METLVGFFITLSLTAIQLEGERLRPQAPRPAPEYTLPADGDLAERAQRIDALNDWLRANRRPRFDLTRPADHG